MMNMVSPEDEIRRTLDALTCQIGDPHTWFIPERGARQLQGLVSGQATTLPGFTLHRVADGRFVVGEVVEGSPAQAAGLTPGDVVRSIAGSPVTMGMRDTFRVSNHELGATVELDVARDDQTLKLELRVSEWRMPLMELRILGAGLGHLRLRVVTTSERGDGDAGALVGRAIEALKDSGIRDLILDLRSNPGGYGVTRVASHFTRADPLLYYASPVGDDEPARQCWLRQGLRRPHRRARRRPDHFIGRNDHACSA